MVNSLQSTVTIEKPVHNWLKKINLCFVAGPGFTPLAQEVVENMLLTFERLGHTIQKTPDDNTDVILTTAAYAEPLPWREAIALTGRMQFNYKHSPTVYTLVNIKPNLFQQELERFERILAKDTVDPKDFEYPGLAPEAGKVLVEQGKRGGAILVLERITQAQSKSIHVLLLVGEKKPDELYFFDLVGGYPHSTAGDPVTFYQDTVLRMITCESTNEITKHQEVGEWIPRTIWNDLETPHAMHNAAIKLGENNFFTEMVIIDHLVQVPAVTDAVASQYSEGCFATWDPELGALISTITGSARPVDKSSLSEDDLAVIVGVRPDRKGALIRKVEGKRNDPPSSEAVELIDMDSALPFIQLPPEWNINAKVPVARSKLHGHRGIDSFNPSLVEFVPLDPAYYNYPVTCATEAQATGIKNAFSRSQALNHPEDPRQVVFTVLPTHGVVIVEKWVHGKVPFQILWEYFESGDLSVSNRVPQGYLEYSDVAGRKQLKHY